MSSHMSLRQCARFLGIPYQTLLNYRLRMQVDIPFTIVGSAKLVDPDVVKRMLIEAGYRFKAQAAEEEMRDQ